MPISPRLIHERSGRRIARQDLRGIPMWVRWKAGLPMPVIARPSTMPTLDPQSIATRNSPAPTSPQKKALAIDTSQCRWKR